MSSDPVFTVPSIESGYVRREALHEKIVAALTRPGGPVIVVGPGGFGKTTAAAAACHDPAVQAAFPDGILWTTVGDRDAGDVEGLLSLHDQLTTDPPPRPAADVLARRIRVLLGGRRFLLAVDDLWRPAHARWFAELGARLLVTTRLELDALKRMNGSWIPADAATPEEARRMLLEGVPELPGDTAGLAALIDRLNGWPLLISLAAGAIRQRLDYGEAPARAVDSVRADLDREGPDALDPHEPDADDGARNTVARSLRASLDRLPVDAAEAFRQLGIFPEDTVLPLAVLDALWGEGAAHARTFARYSLVRLDLAAGTVRIHDSVREWLRFELGDGARDVHRRLLTAWADLYALPNAYAWRHVLEHLSEAGWDDVRVRLLLDPAWIEALLAATDLTTLLRAADPVLAREPDVARLWTILRRSASVLAAEPASLRGQLCGRIRDDDRPRMLAVRDAATQGVAHPWLRPSTACLDSPDDALVQVLHLDAGSVGLTPDGGRVVVGTRDGEVRVWDLASGAPERALLGLDGWVTFVGVTSDGRRLVAADERGEGRVWELDTGRALLSFGDRDRGMLIAATLAGDLVVFACALGLQVWDLRSGERLVSIPMDNEKRPMAVACDGERVVYARVDGPTEILDLATGAVRVLESVERVDSLAFVAPDRLALGTQSEVQVLDPQHPADVLSTYQVPANEGIAPLPDGGLVVSGLGWTTLCRPQGLVLLESTFGPPVATPSQMVAGVNLGGDVLIWDLTLQDRRTFAMVQHLDRVRGIVVSDSRSWALTCAGDGVLAWRLGTSAGRRLSGPAASDASTGAIAPDDSVAVTGGRGGFRAWILAGGESPRSGGSPLVGVTGGYAAARPDGSVEIVEWGGATRWKWQPGSAPISGLRASVDGEWLLASSAGGFASTRVGRSAEGLPRSNAPSADPTRQRWDWAFHGDAAIGCDGTVYLGIHAVYVFPADGSGARLLGAHRNLERLALSRDERRIATVGRDACLRVWDPSHDGPLHEIEAHRGHARGVAFTPSGDRLVTVGEDRVVSLWEVESGRRVATFHADYGLTCCVAIDEDTFLAAGERGALLQLRLDGPTERLEPVRLPTFAPAAGGFGGAELAELLLAAFRTSTELRSFVAVVPGGQGLLSDLSGDIASPRTIAYEFVEKGTARGVSIEEVLSSLGRQRLAPAVRRRVDAALIGRVREGS